MTDLTGRGPIGQKAPKAKRGTKAGILHMERVKALPCAVCHRSGPSDAHHVFHGRYGSRKSSDFETIPLCKGCHLGQNGIHNDKKQWAIRHGFDHEFLPVVAAMLAIA